MAITPGDDIETKTSEPLPRGSWFDRAGKITREVINYFNGKDRLAGEIVSGINRNRQNIVQLETDYQAADGALSTAYIAADAVVAANAANANASLQTTLEAAISSGDTTTLASANSYTNTEVTAEGVARATADDTVLATTRSESQRPNLVPGEYQIIEADLDAAFTVVGGVEGSTGTLNPATGKAVTKFTSDGTLNYMLTRFTPSSTTTNMTLPPARYGIKVLAAYGSTGNISLRRAFLRNASGTIKAIADFGTTFGAGFHLVEGVLDLSSETGVSEYYLDFALNFSSAVAGVTFLPARVQIELIPDDADGPGEWSGAGITAQARILRDAFIGSDGLPVATIRLVAAASGSDPAEIELLSSDGVSSVVITGDTFIDGDLMVSGSIVTDGLASNAVTNSQVSQTAGSISLSNDTWTTVASFSFTSVGIGVELRGTCTINNTASIGSSLGTHEWRLRRDSTTLKSGEGTLASTDDGFVQYRTSHIVADYNDIPSAGTYTYTLQVKIGTTTGAVNSRTVTNRYLSAREFKR